MRSRHTSFHALDEDNCEATCALAKSVDLLEGAAATGFNAALAASKRAKPEEMAMAAASGG
jgi:hypothetical protein